MVWWIRNTARSPPRVNIKQYNTNAKGISEHFFMARSHWGIRVAFNPVASNHYVYQSCLGLVLSSILPRNSTHTPRSLNALLHQDRHSTTKKILYISYIVCLRISTSPFNGTILEGKSSSFLECYSFNHLKLYIIIKKA